MRTKLSREEPTVDKAAAWSSGGISPEESLLFEVID